MKSKIKVFVVDVDNGYEYADAEHQVEGVYKTYRGATEYLLKEGFIPHPIKMNNNTYTLKFEKFDGADKAIEGTIIEFDLND